ncbi:MAG TPA: inorganic phosphate transporter [Candidatus Desulfofervidus auxilii]|uniref:Inorganic phosphate transporter n=1 Tax=Desulfofervidus auxilii TaxID=1621989 RepID=A0A7C0Y6P5_DESA2|nr:inorganic phosphate transporter [Candidatus Desulfofervidus auxilii]
MTEIFPIIACCFIAFGIGSNDTSNALSICIGCGIINFKKAIFWFGCFVLIGILLQGQKVMKTVGRDILEINFFILTVSLFVSAFLIVIFNWKKLPLSTHQVIIGSLVGSGVAFDIDVNFFSFLKIAISWVISPLGAFLLAMILYRIMEKTLSKLPLFYIERVLKILLLISSLLIAYNTGANELATVLGGIVYIDLIKKIQASLLGSFFVLLGAFFLSHRVIETVGKKITALDPYSGFAAQFGAGSCLLLFTSFGMPISTTYCIIGGITGVGILKGIETVKIELIKKIILSLILTPILAFSICFLIIKILR